MTDDQSRETPGRFEIRGSIETFFTKPMALEIRNSGAVAIVGNRFWMRLMRSQMSKRAFRRYRGKERARWKAVARG